MATESIIALRDRKRDLIKEHKQLLSAELPKYKSSSEQYRNVLAELLAINQQIEGLTEQIRLRPLHKRLDDLIERIKNAKSSAELRACQEEWGRIKNEGRGKFDDIEEEVRRGLENRFDVIRNMVTVVDQDGSTIKPPYESRPLTNQEDTQSAIFADIYNADKRARDAADKHPEWKSRIITLVTFEGRLRDRDDLSSTLVRAIVEADKGVSRGLTIKEEEFKEIFSESLGARGQEDAQAQVDLLINTMLATGNLRAVLKLLENPQNALGSKFIFDSMDPATRQEYSKFFDYSKNPSLDEKEKKEVLRQMEFMRWDTNEKLAQGAQNRLALNIKRYLAIFSVQEQSQFDHMIVKFARAGHIRPEAVDMFRLVDESEQRLKADYELKRVDSINESRIQPDRDKNYYLTAIEGRNKNMGSVYTHSELMGEIQKDEQMRMANEVTRKLASMLASTISIETRINNTIYEDGGTRKIGDPLNPNPSDNSNSSKINVDFKWDDIVYYLDNVDQSRYSSLLREIGITNLQERMSQLKDVLIYLNQVMEQKGGRDILNLLLGSRRAGYLPNALSTLNNIPEGAIQKTTNSTQDFERTIQDNTSRMYEEVVSEALPKIAAQLRDLESRLERANNEFQTASSDLQILENQKSVTQTEIFQSLIRNSDDEGRLNFDDIPEYQGIVRDIHVQIIKNYKELLRKREGHEKVVPRSTGFALGRFSMGGESVPNAIARIRGNANLRADSQEGVWLNRYNDMISQIQDFNQRLEDVARQIYGGIMERRQQELNQYRSRVSKFGQESMALSNTIQLLRTQQSEFSPLQ